MTILLLACGLMGHAQAPVKDSRPVVGVSAFSCEQDDTYAGLVTEKVFEQLTATRRFRVVDRTSYDKVKAELELQKSEAFMDSENLVEQDVAVAAERMITGHINKVPVWRIRNSSDGSVRGYKASVSFQLKVVDVATGLSTEASSFEGKCTKEMLSPESAVTAAMQSLEDELYEYFRLNFPIEGSIVRVVKENKGAEVVLLNVGKQQGINVGDRLTVSYVEMLEGQPLPHALGDIKVKALAGENFSECAVPKKMREQVQQHLANGTRLTCRLIVKP